MSATAVAGAPTVAMVVSMRSLKPPRIFVLSVDKLGGGAARVVVGVVVTLSSDNQR